MSQTLRKFLSRLVLSHGRDCRLQAAGYRNSPSPISYLLSPARLALVAAAVLAMSGAAQAQVYWDFGTANPTSGVPASLS